MKLIICSLSIEISKTNATLSLLIHRNQSSSTLLNINNSESPEKNFSFVNSSALQFKFKFKWGSKGTGNDQFRRPHDVAFDSKSFVYATDRENNNTQKFTHNGTFVKAWVSRGSGDGQFVIPYSIDIVFQRPCICSR